MNYKLSDGTVIKTATHPKNKTGYLGASLWPTFNNDIQTPFVAACGNPSNQSIRKQMRCQHRTSWHGGAYKDVREAAYVAARFKADPVGTDQIIGIEKAFRNFPKDLYKLPVTMNKAKAVKVIAKRSNKKTTKRKDIIVKFLQEYFGVGVREAEKISKEWRSA